MILSERDRADLHWALRFVIIESVRNNDALTNEQKTSLCEFSKELTYEQALNLLFSNTNETLHESVMLECTLLDYYIEEGILDPIKKAGGAVVGLPGKVIRKAIGVDKIKVGVDDETIKKSADAARQVSKEIPENIVVGTEKALKDMVRRHKGLLSTSGWIAGGIAAAVAAAWIYRKFFTQTAKAKKRCSGLTGDQFNKCMYNIKLMSASKTVAALKSALGKCGKSKNPEKCKKQYDKALADWNQRLTVIKRSK